jgi:hypothetical protein
LRLAPPDLASLQHICRNLRERDRLEIEASETDPDPDLTASRLISAWRYCGVIGQVVSRDDEPIAVLTILEITPRAVGCGMIATDRWGEVAKAYSRYVKRTIIPKVIAQGFRRFEARAWEHHYDSRRWLQWLGAHEECRIPQWGKNGETFIQYGLIADVHIQQQEAAGSGDSSPGAPAPALDHRHLVGSAG